MKAVKVEYTVKEDFVEQNKQNIQKVMDALKAKPIVGMQYSSYTDKEQANTFVHINMAKDAETMAQLSDIPEFVEFRTALMASGPLSPPKQTNLDFIGAGFTL